MAHCFAHAVVGRHHRHGELGLAQRDLARERVGGAVGRLLAPGVGDHGRPAPVEIGRREAGEVRQVDQLALGHHRAGNHAFRRLHQRALVVERDQERQLAQRAPGGASALQQQGHGAGGELSRLGPVDVRVGAVGDQAVGVLHHLRRDVGMIVEADGDGHARAHGGAHAAQQLALAVLERLAHHGAVQVEIDGVDRHRRRQPPDQLARDPLVGIGRDEPAGAAAGPQQRHDVVAGAHVAQEARQREAGVAEPFDHVRAAHQRRAVAVAGEVGEVRPLGDEAVGFMMEPADRDARHGVALARCSRILPLPIVLNNGERVRVRGRRLLQRLWPPLTLTLSPRKSGERGSARRSVCASRPQA